MTATKPNRAARRATAKKPARLTLSEGLTRAAQLQDAMTKAEELETRANELERRVNDLAPVVPTAAAPINAIQIVQMPGQQPQISWNGWSALEVIGLLPIMCEMVKNSVLNPPPPPAAA